MAWLAKDVAGLGTKQRVVRKIRAACYSPRDSMIAAESSWERSRRGDICCLCRSLNLQIESKTRKESRGRRKVIDDACHGLAVKNYDG